VTFVTYQCEEADSLSEICSFLIRGDGLPHRQTYGEIRAFAQLAFDSDPPVVSLNDPLGQRQT